MYATRCERFANRPSAKFCTLKYTPEQESATFHAARSASDPRLVREAVEHAEHRHEAASERTTGQNGCSSRRRPSAKRWWWLVHARRRAPRRRRRGRRRRRRRGRRDGAAKPRHSGICRADAHRSRRKFCVARRREQRGSATSRLRRGALLWWRQQRIRTPPPSTRRVVPPVDGRKAMRRQAVEACEAAALAMPVGRAHFDDGANGRFPRRRAPSGEMVFATSTSHRRCNTTGEVSSLHVQRRDSPTPHAPC